MSKITELLRSIERWAPDTLTQTKYWSNTPLDWIIAALLAIVVAVVVRIAKAFVVRQLRKVTRKSATYADDILVDTIDATRALFYIALGLYVGTLVLEVRPSARKALDVAIVIAVLIQSGFWTQTLFTRFADRWSEKQTGSQSTTVAAGIKFAARLGIWSIVVLMTASNLGIEIGALVAGLGIGGVAAALALQNILGDVFASVSMYFDRPFDIGDFIIVDDFMGNVERIGLRTTRIRSLGGEQIVFSNGDLVKSRIRNYARMSERRILFNFGIEYNHTVEKVQRAAKIAAEVIQSMQGVRFDRAHFKSYGAYSLDFEVVYYVLSPDYGEYMNKQQEINLAIYRRFQAEEIRFAFPTRTLFHRNELAQRETGSE